MNTRDLDVDVFGGLIGVRTETLPVRIAPPVDADFLTPRPQTGAHYKLPYSQWEGAPTIVGVRILPSFWFLGSHWNDTIEVIRVADVRNLLVNLRSVSGKYIMKDFPAAELVQGVDAFGDTLQRFIYWEPFRLDTQESYLQLTDFLDDSPYPCIVPLQLIYAP